MQYYLAAMKPTTHSPCTNVPFNCPICPQAETFWKYTFIIHVVNKHLTDDNDLPFLPMELWATTHISKWEESKMGIPGVKTDEWRTFRQLPDSDVVYQIEEEMMSSEEEGDEELERPEVTVTTSERDSRKRGLSTVSTQSRQGSPTKKAQLGY
jgi:hypothetical protein